MQILRTITSNSKGEFLGDNWHMFKTRKELMEMLSKLDPHDFQCFDATDISNEILYDLEKLEVIKEKEERRKLWEELNREFNS